MSSRLAVVLFALTLACGRTEPYDFPPGTAEQQPSPQDMPQVDPKPVLEQTKPMNCQIDEVEQHTLPPFARRPIDVLFVVDDSCSMSDDQTQLGVNFEAFISTFRANQVDFQLGAVTTDMRAANRSGRLVTPFLTRRTPELPQAFRRMVSVGTRGSGTEQGLGAARAALTEPLLGTTNFGLVRSDADFALVFVGDEDDQSTVDISAFAEQVKTMKGTNNVTVAAALGLDTSFFCWPGVLAQWRLAQFTRRFGESSLLALCRDDYADMLRAIAGRVVNGKCIVSLRRPLAQDRQVHITLNGQPATFVLHAPDENNPNGSLEVEPCLPSGGVVAIAYDSCRP